MDENLSHPPIQSLWIGKTLSKVEQLCIKSFLDNGHPFHLYTYEDVQNVPLGTTIKNANDILNREQIFTLQNGWGEGSYAGFADWFRLELLNKLGGWWVDTDVICLKPFDLKQNIVISSSFEYSWGECANNCILKSTPASIFTKSALQEIFKIELKNSNFGDIGPHLVQRLVTDLKLQDAVVPYYYFNPISWGGVSDVILKRMPLKNRIKEKIRPIFKPQTLKGRRILNETYALHLWNEVWRQFGLDKNATYSPSSIFEKLKQKHGV